MIVSCRGSRREPVVKKGGNTVIPSFYLFYLQIKGLFYFAGIISSIGTIAAHRLVLLVKYNSV